MQFTPPQAQLCLPSLSYPMLLYLSFVLDVASREKALVHTRLKFRENEKVTELSKVEELVNQAEQACKYIEENVVQGVRNAKGPFRTSLIPAQTPQLKKKSLFSLHSFKSPLTLFLQHHRGQVHRKDTHDQGANPLYALLSQPTSVERHVKTNENQHFGISIQTQPFALRAPKDHSMQDIQVGKCAPFRATERCRGRKRIPNYLNEISLFSGTLSQSFCFVPFSLPSTFQPDRPAFKSISYNRVSLFSLLCPLDA